MQGAGLVLGLLPALVFDPRQQACSQCPANLLSVTSNQDAVRVLAQWGVWLGLVWPVALAAVAACIIAAGNAVRRATS